MAEKALVLFCLGGLIWGLALAQPDDLAPCAVSAAEAETTLYEAPDGDFSAAYPAGWKIKRGGPAGDGSSYTTFQHPSCTAGRSLTVVGPLLPHLEEGEAETTENMLLAVLRRPHRDAVDLATVAGQHRAAMVETSGIVGEEWREVKEAIAAGSSYWHVTWRGWIHTWAEDAALFKLVSYSLRFPSALTVEE